MKKRRIFLGCFAVALLIILLLSFYQHKTKAPATTADQNQSEIPDSADSGAEFFAEKTPDPVDQMFSSPEAPETIGVVSELLENAGPEIIEVLAAKDPGLKTQYGEGGWTLMHIASYQCSEEMVNALHMQGKLSWNIKAKDGTTPLTIAAERKCLAVLEYWRSKKASFKAEDGRGVSALSVLQQNRDDKKLEPLLSALEGKKPAPSKFAKNSFYRKREFPDSIPVGKHLDIDLSDRPNEAQETADISEFAD